MFRVSVFVRIALIGLLLCASAAIVAVRSGALEIPEHYNPWAPLELDAQPNFLTRFKLAQLSDDPEKCQIILETSGFEYERVPDRMTGVACGLHNVVLIERTGVGIEEPFPLSCRAAISLALWERHVVQPAAQSYFQQRVAGIEHYGSYACRNVYGRPRATRSRHATAEALDIAGFVLEDGTRIRVLQDWEGGGHSSSSRNVPYEFLRTLRDGACKFFDGVLTPDYNEAHRDHFHLDRGPHRVCR
jgi:hypothetical protein